MIGGGEERKECNTFKADHKNSDPEKPNTSLFPEDGVLMTARTLILQKKPDTNVMMVMIVIPMMVNLKVEDEAGRKQLAPFKPVPPARPPHLARTL